MFRYSFDTSKKKAGFFDVSVYSLGKTSLVVQSMELAPSKGAQPSRKFESYSLLNKVNVNNFKNFEIKNSKLWGKNLETIYRLL